MIRGKLGSALGLVKQAIQMLQEQVDRTKLSGSSLRLVRSVESTLNNLEMQAVGVSFCVVDCLQYL